MEISEQNFVPLSDQDGEVAVILPFGSTFHIKGKVTLAAIFSGGLDICGSKFDSSNPENVDIYSPKGYSLLSFEAFEVEGKTPPEIVRPELRKLVKKFSSSAAIYVMKKLETEWTHMLDSCLRYSDSQRHKIALFGRERGYDSVNSHAEEILNVTIVFPQNVSQIKCRLFHSCPDWETAIQSFNIAMENRGKYSGQFFHDKTDYENLFLFSVHPKILAVGGKGVGKSTFLRYFVNRILPKSGPVLWIDLDPGQAEFTLPGCVSSCIVKKPLLGPNFTHIQNDDIKTFYVGGVNVSDLAKRYTECVQQLFNFIASDEKLSSMPWIVNTMGFNKGLGIRLLKMSANLVKPTTVFEIKSRFAKKNFEVPMSRILPSGSHVLTFSAMPESADVKEMAGGDMWGIPEAYKLRDIVILSYLGMNFKTSLQSATPYAVSLDSLSFQAIHCHLSFSSLLGVLNMSLVSLGHLESRSKDSAKIEFVASEVIVPSLGFGVVRGIDAERRTCYILTSLPLEELNMVNCLTVGSVQVPNGIYLSSATGKTRNPRPFVAKRPKENTPLNSTWQKSTKPVQNILPSNSS